jgi:hypothetical protein
VFYAFAALPLLSGVAAVTFNPEQVSEQCLVRLQELLVQGMAIGIYLEEVSGICHILQSCRKHKLVSHNFCFFCGLLIAFCSVLLNFWLSIHYQYIYDSEYICCG